MAVIRHWDHRRRRRKGGFQKGFPLSSAAKSIAGASTQDLASLGRDVAYERNDCQVVGLGKWRPAIEQQPSASVGRINSGVALFECSFGLTQYHQIDKTHTVVSKKRGKNFGDAVTGIEEIEGNISIPPMGQDSINSSTPI